MRGQSDNYKPMSMVAQVADVKTTLVSVHRLLEAGNRVHFERGNCYVEHVETKRKTEIIERDGAFEVGFWVPRETRDVNQEERDNCGRLGFTRQDRGA